MGEYTDVKRNKILHALKKLSKINGFEVDTAANHQWIIKHRMWPRPFPVPFKHNKVKKCYIQALVKRIVATGDCDEGTFKEWLR